MALQVPVLTYGFPTMSASAFHGLVSGAERQEKRQQMTVRLTIAYLATYEVSGQEGLVLAVSAPPGTSRRGLRSSLEIAYWREMARVERISRI
jgi:hypothetical protein